MKEMNLKYKFDGLYVLTETYEPDATFYVYAYLDPRKPGVHGYIDKITGLILEFDYEPFYIGKGCGDRHDVHLRASENSNSKKKNKINKITMECGIPPIIHLLHVNLIEQVAYDREIFYIDVIGRNSVHPNSPLTNLLPGGKGMGAGINNPCSVKLIDGSGNTHGSMSEAARFYSISQTSVQAMLQGKIPNKHGLMYVGDEKSELRKRHSDNKKNKKSHASIAVKSKDGNTFPSIKSTALFYNASSTTIRNMLSGTGENYLGLEIVGDDKAEFRKKLVAKSGNRNSVSIQIKDFNGNVFESITQATNYHKLSHRTIRDMLNGVVTNRLGFEYIKEDYEPKKRSSKPSSHNAVSIKDGLGNLFPSFTAAGTYHQLSKTAIRFMLDGKSPNRLGFEYIGDSKIDLRTRMSKAQNKK